jgi:hypothetical protein
VDQALTFVSFNAGTTTYGHNPSSTFGAAKPIGGNSLAVPAARLISVDALRGFDMFWIIGAGAVVHALDATTPNALTQFLSAQLRHVNWEGFHFYDMIFPLFLFSSSSAFRWSSR